MSDPVQLPLTEPDISVLSGGGSLVRRSVLPSGLRVLSEYMPAAASATVGFWVPVGSRDETEGTFGSTHFLEHLLFKGTPSRSAFEIATSFDEVGGEHNAMTSKESTCYYAKVRDTDLAMAVEVLADMVTSSTIDPAEFDTERGVILEELAMADDDPADVAGERLSELVFGETTPLGRPIGGTKESIREADRERVWAHYKQRYTPSDLVVTVAGAVDHDILVQLVTSALQKCGWSLDEQAAPLARRSTELLQPGPGGVKVIDRPLEQVNLMVGMPALVATDERRPTVSVLNSVLGGGMSSRLFQEIRERRGLAYSVYSFAGAYADAGMFGMYAGCGPAKAREVADLMVRELEGIAESGITETERQRAVGMTGGASALALEDSDTRMARLARAELSFGQFSDLETNMARISAVTSDDVRDLAGELLAGERSVVAVGRVDADRFDG
ncbi:MAG: M16 family metallopeptidase [Agrococcus casei]|uniref:M16 family metallopeptidase n=1 Tax=Agrococcus casei TaxID=343512 RepID=UPI003F91EBC9